MTRLRALAAQPVIPIDDDTERARLSALCAELNEEHSLAREGYRLAMRGLLVLIAVGVARLAASRARTGARDATARGRDGGRSCAIWSMNFSAPSACSAFMPTSSA